MAKLNVAANVIINEVADICSDDVTKWRRYSKKGEDDKYEIKMNMKSEIVVFENIVFCTIKLTNKYLLSHLLDQLHKKFDSMGMKFVFVKKPEDGLMTNTVFCRDIEEGINPVTCIGRINFAGMDMTVNVNLANDEATKYANPDFKHHINDGGTCSEYNPENHVRRLGENDYVYLKVDDIRTVNEKWKNFINAYYKVYGISLPHCKSISLNIKYDMKF